jgi:hypothetical protein
MDLNHFVSEMEPIFIAMRWILSLDIYILLNLTNYTSNTFASSIPTRKLIEHGALIVGT